MKQLVNHSGEGPWLSIILEFKNILVCQKNSRNIPLRLSPLSILSSQAVA